MLYIVQPFVLRLREQNSYKCAHIYKLSSRSTNKVHFTKKKFVSCSQTENQEMPMPKMTPTLEIPFQTQYLHACQVHPVTWDLHPGALIGFMQSACAVILRPFALLLTGQGFFGINKWYQFKLVIFHILSPFNQHEMCTSKQKKSVQ